MLTRVRRLSPSLFRALFVWPAFVAAVGFVLWMTLRPAFPVERVDHAVVFLADMSSSIQPEEKRVVRESHAVAIASREVVSAIQSGSLRQSAFVYVEFAVENAVICPWTIIASQEQADAFAKCIREEKRSNLGSNTGISKAMRTAIDLFNSMPFDPTYRTVDVVGDGDNDGAPHVSVPRQVLIDMNASINGLPITLSPDPGVIEYYRNEVIGGRSHFLIDVRDIGEMPMAMRRKLILELY